MKDEIFTCFLLEIQVSQSDCTSLLSFCSFEVQLSSALTGSPTGLKLLTGYTNPNNNPSLSTNCNCYDVTINQHVFSKDTIPMYHYCRL